jgi:hypothetical protein
MKVSKVTKLLPGLPSRGSRPKDAEQSFHHGSARCREAALMRSLLEDNSSPLSKEMLFQKVGGRQLHRSTAIELETSLRQLIASGVCDERSGSVIVTDVARHVHALLVVDLPADK